MFLTYLLSPKSIIVICFIGPHFIGIIGFKDDNEIGEEEEGPAKGARLPFQGNDKTMNMNPLILANVTNSPYFKVVYF